VKNEQKFIGLFLSKRRRFMGRTFFETNILGEKVTGIFVPMLGHDAKIQERPCLEFKIKNY